jgi:hypothetical protein
MLPGAASHADGACTDLDLLTSVLGEAVAVLEGSALPHLLIGGLASSLLGRPRCSLDIDLFMRPEHAEHALAAFEAKGFRTERTNPNWLYKAIRRDVLVDVLFQAKGGMFVDDEMLRRSICRVYRDVPVRVAPAEDLIVMKALAHDEDTPRHWHDALGLVAAGRLDWDYLLWRSRHGRQRVLSLLLYATSIDLYVPRRTLSELSTMVLEDREPRWNPRI